ncbi:MAG: RidA family protein [Chlorobi bacterium]|nr:RidA family protein [Chlorobiota bacterium]
MSDIQTIYSDHAPDPIGPYSQAKRFGDLVFTAGQIGLDSEGKLAQGVADQTHQAVANLRAVLQAGGARLESVLKTTIFLADMNDFARVNEVYAQYFGDSSPARSTVEAARLPKDALVEIEAIAIVPLLRNSSEVRS